MKKRMILLLMSIFFILALTACANAADRTTVSGTVLENSGPTQNATVSQEAGVQKESAAFEVLPVSGSSYDGSLMTGVEISFDYKRMSTHASNQLAVWIEDADHNLVKTIFVTSFTLGRRGYRNREMSLNHWVSAANPESMADAEIDAISSATPAAGRLSYVWDLTDGSGARVPDGVYFIKVEGTLFWESNILFTAEMDTLGSEGFLGIQEDRSEPGNTENEDMIANVAVSVRRESVDPGVAASNGSDVGRVESVERK